MNKENVFKFITDKKLIVSIIVVIISIIIYKILKKIINIRIDKIKDSNKANSKKHKTYLKLFNSGIKYLFVIIDLIAILQIYGINVSSIVAGLGVVSIITGLALQDAFKDIIAGFNIILDNYFAVGDVIKIDDVEGKILQINLKTTKLKDINNENVLVIANRNIAKALNISNQLDIDIPIPYEENTTRIEGILYEIINQIKNDKNVQDIKYMGVNEFGESAIFYKLRLWCIPEQKPQVKRNALRIIKLKLDENNINIPYMQIDIHQK